MDTKVIHDTFAASESGQLIFPAVVEALAGAGVESYFVDLAHRTANFYLSTGETHIEPLTHPGEPIAPNFSFTALLAAIRGAQADQVRYPEFLKQIADAGTIAYWAFLTGKKVIYFGRKGEFHIEEFPEP